MSKLSITRFIETSRFIATEAGQQLSDFITYMADFAEQSLRALRNGLTFGDNMNCLIVNATLQDQVAQVINSNNRTPFLIFHTSISTTTAISSLIWYNNSSNQLVVKPSFVGSPTDKIAVVLVLVFQ